MTGSTSTATIYRLAGGFAIPTRRTDPLQWPVDALNERTLFATRARARAHTHTHTPMHHKSVSQSVRENDYTIHAFVVGIGSLFLWLEMDDFLVGKVYIEDESIVGVL